MDKAGTGDKDHRVTGEAGQEDKAGTEERPEGGLGPGESGQLGHFTCWETDAAGPGDIDRLGTRQADKAGTGDLNPKPYTLNPTP